MLFLVQALELVSFVIIADAVLSWVQRPEQTPRRYTMMLTDPIYQPLRKILNPQKTGGLDLSPLILLVGLRLLSDAIQRAVM